MGEKTVRVVIPITTQIKVFSMLLFDCPKSNQKGLANNKLKQFLMLFNYINF